LQTRFSGFPYASSPGPRLGPFSVRQRGESPRTVNSHFVPSPG
jgi:hypothetical protein